MSETTYIIGNYFIKFMLLVLPIIWAYAGFMYSFVLTRVYFIRYKLGFDPSYVSPNQEHEIKCLKQKCAHYEERIRKLREIILKKVVET